VLSGMSLLMLSRWRHLVNFEEGYHEMTAVFRLGTVN
jgi:hypothetical protein